MFQGKDIDFCMLYNNRNIRRKLTSDTILAFREFAYGLPKEKRDKVAFVLHTQPVDQNGTDIPAVIKEICPEYNVKIVQDKVDDKRMNWLYNIGDCNVLFSLDIQYFKQ